MGDKCVKVPSLVHWWSRDALARLARESRLHCSTVPPPPAPDGPPAVAVVMPAAATVTGRLIRLHHNAKGPKSSSSVM
ncbi:hypothetical protein NHX12_005334 [Muraenolepis orangiensis]|uniref:Uncharacterized protein n=1 Tax=Muraenolepis orangiensis TaxID=630683 RepID=A0A9Q0DSR0_9TELE|nr:hypothetical protein NHX12_005334 [Muraenolepis orangiensis]